MKRAKKLLHFPYFYPSLVSLAVFLLSLLAWHFTSRNIKLHDEARFRFFSSQLEHELAYRIKSYIQVLIQTRNMFFVTHEVDRQEFQIYVKNLKLNDEYPGIQGIGYSEKVQGSVADFEARVRKEGYPDFKLWPSSKREEFHSIIFIQPFSWRNQRAFGFDMFSHPVRKVAMIRARDQGVPAATGVVKLMQETTEEIQYGILIYVPLYQSSRVLAGLEERRKNLKGFIYGAFRIRDLFNSIFSHFGEGNPIGVKIFMHNKHQPIYQSPLTDSGPADFTHRFILDVRSTPVF